MKKRALPLSPSLPKQFGSPVFGIILLSFAMITPLTSLHAQTTKDNSVKTAWKESVEKHFASSHSLSLSPSDAASFADSQDSILSGTSRRWSQKGKASWYTGRRVHGTTALTAAHRSLPFGTKLLVKAPETGRSVIVTVNDRGPFIKGRIIDLSKVAASHLGIVSKGTSNVVISKITPAQTREIEVAEAPDTANSDEAIEAAAPTSTHHSLRGRQHKHRAHR